MGHRNAHHPARRGIGAIRLRSYGIYSYRIADPRTFFTQISSTHQSYFVYDLDHQLRNTIVARMADVFAASGLSYLDLTANESAFSEKVSAQIRPAFLALGLELTSSPSRTSRCPTSCRSRSTSASA